MQSLHIRRTTMFQLPFATWMNFVLFLGDHIYKSSAIAEMGDRGHNRHGPKIRAAVPLPRGELGPRLTHYGLGRGLLPYQVASSSIQPFGHNRQGRKLGAVPLLGELLRPLFGGGVAQLPEQRPTSITSGILTHPAIWPQQKSAENWGLCPLLGGELGPNLAQCSLD